ncbi:MAG TPA: multiheme c-type cytochrome [Dongiaceae bacterium]|nr:multiheme c-type cytochrome [Dongiaceae bacterium]
MPSILKSLLTCICTLVAAPHLLAAPLPQEAPATHLGVASCASGVCHGVVAPKTDSNILQNEYRTWTQHDMHARAYKVLMNDESKKIAQKLGLPNAHEAKICLDCHADNVGDGKRGRRFQISDGIGCEACHGGAEQWIKSHTEPGVTHEANLKAGMYPTEDPHARAQLCLSCHLGTKDKLATHEIMGAGHPRLSFELDTFTVLQPEHYVKDDDYRKRKPDISSPQIWATGQISAAQRTLELLASSRFHSGGLFPEISFYDCHSCHHPMNDVRWQNGEGLKPGALRLNDAYLQMSGLLVSELLPAKTSTWRDGTRALQQAGSQSPDAVKKHAQALLQQVPDILARFRQVQTPAEQKALLRRLLGDAQKGAFHDYAGAEQLVMGCSVLFSSLKLDDTLRTTLDNLYQVLDDEHRFQPERLRAAAGKALADVERHL